MLLSPCKDCKERYFDCHMKCDKYKNFEAIRRKIMNGRLKEIDLYNALSDIRRAGEAARKR